MYTHQIGVFLFLRFLVVPWLILPRFALPHILECSAHQRLAHQNAKVNQEEGIDRPESTDVKCVSVTGTITLCP